MRTEQAFRKIIGAATEYQTNTAKALQTYQHERDANADLLSEEGKRKQRAAAVEKAMRALSRAKDDFQASAADELETIRSEWQQYLTRAPKSEVIDQIKVYSDFGIQPTRTEIEYIIEKSFGNVLALRALNITLAKVGSSYRISLPDTAQFETDLLTIERMIKNPFGATLDFIGAYREITGEESVPAIMKAQAFTSWITSLQETEKRWADVSRPIIQSADRSAGNGQPAQEETKTAAVEEGRAAAELVTEEPQDVALAKKIAAQSTSQAEPAKRIIEHYTGKA